MRSAADLTHTDTAYRRVPTHWKCIHEGLGSRWFKKSPRSCYFFPDNGGRGIRFESSSHMDGKSQYLLFTHCIKPLLLLTLHHNKAGVRK